VAGAGAAVPAAAADDGDDWPSGLMLLLLR